MNNKEVSMVVAGVLIIFCVLFLIVWGALVWTHGSFSAYKCHMSTDYNGKKACYEMLHNETNDIRLCDKSMPKYKNHGGVTQCMVDGKDQIQDAGDCNRFKSSILQSICKGVFAGKTNDPQSCMGQRSSEINCVSAYAYYIESAEACNLMIHDKREFNVNNCKIAVAKKTKDLTICDTIPVSSSRDWSKYCREQVIV